MPQSSSEAGGLVAQTPENGTLANNGYHGSMALPPEVLSRKRRPLWSGIVIPIVVAVVCGVAAFIVSNYFMTRWYTTSTTIWFPASAAQGNAGILNSLIGGGGTDASGSTPILGVYNSQQFGVSTGTAMTALDSGRVKSAVMEKLNLPARWHLPGDKAAERFEKNVTFGLDKDGLLSVMATDTNPRLAQQIVNAYVEEMREVSTDLSTSLARRNLAAVRLRYADAQANLQRQENELVALRSEAPQIPMPLGNSATNFYADLVNQQAATQTALSETNAEIQAQLQTAQKTYGQNTQLPASVPFAQTTVQNLRKAESDFDQIKSIYGPDYPGYREAQNRLNQARAEADAEMKRQLTATTKFISPEMSSLYIKRATEQAQLATLEQQAATRKSDMLSLPAAQMREDDLQRSISLSNQLDVTLAQAVTQAELAENRDAPTFETIDPAGIPVEPSQPRVLYMTALATVAGLLLALGWQTAAGLLRQPATQDALRRYADAYGLTEEDNLLTDGAAVRPLIAKDSPAIPLDDHVRRELPRAAAPPPALEETDVDDPVGR